MLTAFQLKNIAESGTCKYTECLRISASLFSRFAYWFFHLFQFFIPNHVLPLSKSTVFISGQMANRSDLSIFDDISMLQAGATHPSFPGEAKTKILDLAIRIHVPSQDLRGRKFNNRKLISELSILFARLFKGYTQYKTKGGWLGESGRIIRENTLVIESFTTLSEFIKHFKQLEGVIMEIKKQYNQESVAVTIGNRMYLF